MDPIIQFDPNLGTEYIDSGFGLFPNGQPPPPGPVSFDITGSPCPNGQLPIPPHGCVSQCTEEQLRRVGYKKPTVVYPQHPRDHEPERRTQQEPGTTYTGNIRIRCLEPSPLPPPKNLTIVEVRPPAPAAPPPEHVFGPRPKPPPTPPPLFLREQPPTPPPLPSDEICYVKLPPPPAPPPQLIRHIFHPFPAKPRDIIIERWLPYRRLLPEKFVVVPAPPYNPQPVRDVIITHIHPEARINHHIDKDPRPKQINPEQYRQHHGPTLLRKQEILDRVLSELYTQHANEVTLRSIRAIFQVHCNENNELHPQDPSSIFQHLQDPQDPNSIFQDSQDPSLIFQHPEDPNSIFQDSQYFNNN